MNTCRIKWIVFQLVGALACCYACVGLNPSAMVTDENLLQTAESLMHADFDEPTGGLVIYSPYDGAVFPPEIAASEFLWEDKTAGVRNWLVAVEVANREPLYFFSDRQKWLPERETWEEIKKNSVDSPALITIIGFMNFKDPVILSKNSLRIFTSKDPVGALVLYRQVPLPFMVGEENFKKMKWRLGDLSSYEQPPVIMENIPVCASCHQVSGDGRRITMEMNYQNDSGAQFLADVSETIRLFPSDFMTWSDFPKPDILPATRGLFARMSPSGKHIAATVNEITFAALTSDPAYCQVFFPTYGVLGIYSAADQRFQALPGADDTDFIQTNPDWHPDETVLVFARSETKNAYHEDLSNIETRIENRGAEDLNREFPVQFDIWKVPFSHGEGGVPEPLVGASLNGMSNYFARYSPDGRWIVFTRSRYGIMLQPDSRLFIVPAEGGEAREMRCNQKKFNSWHSWSPNGRWLLFSSKANSMYTEIFITHIDENGNDTVPVCLSRFSDPKMAANVPEFVHMNTARIREICLGR